MSVDCWGTLKEPTAYVPSKEAGPSDVARRAERSSPAGYTEDLGRWGDDPWKLPGFGDSGAKCGEWYPASVCDGCGHLDLGTHSCGRRSCPDCWGIWARDGGVRATTRIQSFRHTLPDDYRRQVAHAAVSPPEGDVMNERQFWAGRGRAAEIAAEKGFRGFAVIPHPWRATDAAKTEYRQADPDAGLWVWLRSEFSEVEIRDRIYWSPHYHIIGSTTADMDEGGADDAWNYVFIRSLESYNGIRDRPSHEDLYGAFRYLLSHTGYPEGSTHQAVTWYGDLANNKFVEDAAADWQHEKPSEGVRAALRREIGDVAGVTDEDDEDGAGSDERDDLGDCPCDGCEGVLIDVFDVRRYLRHNDPPPGVAKRMKTAYEWRIGRDSPPPGLKHPRTEDEAREAFAEML